MFKKSLILSITALGIVSATIPTPSVQAVRDMYLPGREPASYNNNPNLTTIDGVKYDNGVRVMTFGNGTTTKTESQKPIFGFQNITRPTNDITTGVRSFGISFTSGNNTSTANTTKSSGNTIGYTFTNGYTGGIESKSSSSSSSSVTTSPVRNLTYGGTFSQSTNNLPATNAPINNFTTGECSGTASYTAEMLRQINEFRMQNGVPSLAIDQALTNVGCAHSKWMNRNNVLDHTGFENTDPFQRCFRAGTTCDGENIYYNTNPTVTAAMDWFKNSSSHRNNMLNRDFKTAGFSLYGIYTTQVFRR